MAENTLTGLIPDAYAALDVVSRELTGMIPSVSVDVDAEAVGINQNIRVNVEPAGTAGDITPAMAIPDPTGQTSGYTDIVITKSRAAEFGFNGEDQKKLNSGIGLLNSRAGKIAQALRVLVNEVETDLCALQSTFSRAYGTPATTPFGTAADYTDASFTRKILVDNGSPEFDNHLVLNTAAGANIRGKQAAVDQSGTDSILRQGILLDTSGMSIRESAQIVTNTAGTAASATTDNAGYAVGATVLTLAVAGTGTLLAGDIVTFAGDTNKYQIVSGDADVSNGGTITLAEPGLRVAMSAATKAITVVAAAARNMAFNRSALYLAARPPARPEEGDQASDVMLIVDPRSGLPFEFSIYPGYRKVRYEVALAWGVKNIKPEHTALLLG